MSGGFCDTHQVSLSRSLVLCAIGALTGLSVAGFGLFTAAGTSTHRLPPEDVALVNQRPILRSDFITQLESETGQPYEASTVAERRRVLEEMVREELLVQRALELNFAETDQATRNALVATISAQATVQVTTSPPTDPELAAFYAAHRERYASDGTMWFRELLLPQAAARPAAGLPRAAAAVAALRAHEPIERVSARYGLIEPQRFDDNYYFAAEYRLGKPVFAQVRNLDKDQVSEPLAVAQGLAIIVMLANQRPIPLAFAAARNQVFTDYQAAAHDRALATTLRYLRDRAQILLADEFTVTAAR